VRMAKVPLCLFPAPSQALLRPASLDLRAEQGCAPEVIAKALLPLSKRMYAKR